ncbi:unnamed protein product [Trichobilharzia szidati]|nr:unnamed protein product [Trichobilharzia szidati]
MFFKNFGSMTTPQSQASSSSSNKQALSQTDNNNTSCNNNNNKSMSGSTVTKTLTMTTTAATSSSPSSCQVIMNRCLAAYSQAAKDRSTALEPSFHYNRGLAWHYRDMFGKTLTCWLQAVCLDPDWPAPQNCIKRIIKFILEWKTFMQQLSEIHSCTGSCSMEKKSSDQRRQQQRQEIDEFIVPLNPLTKLLTVSTKENSNWSENNGDNQTNQSSPNYDNNKLTLDIKDKTALSRLLGPCCPLINNSVVDQHDDNSVVDDKSVANMKQKGSDKTNNSNNNKKKKRLKSAKHTNSSSNTLTNSNELRLLTSVIDTSQIHVGLFKDLQIGLNKNTVCVGRVYAELPADTDLARNFLLVDAYGMPFTVRVYNIGKGKGPIRKDIIVIPNPFVEEIFIEGFILHSCITALSKLDSKYLSEDIINKLANLNKDTDTTIDKSDNMKESDFTSLPPSHLLSNSTADLHIRLIRIPLPDLLVVNGQPVGSSWTGAPVFKTVFFTGI